MILEQWMIRNLDDFGNCLIGKKFYKTHGEEAIVNAVKELGYEHANIQINKQSGDSFKTIIIQTRQLQQLVENKKVSKK